MRSQRSRAAAVWLLAVLLGGCSESPPAPAGPNVVLVTADDLGWADLPCYGNEWHQTPHLDTLCAEGARFTHAYAPSAVCSPSRAGILTGRSPARIGLTDWISIFSPATDARELGWVDDPEHRLLTPESAAELAREERTLAELLAARGYATAHIGKWHLGRAREDGRGTLPDDQGFALSRGGGIIGRTPTYFDPYHGQRSFGLRGLPPRQEGEYLTDRLADEAVAFIDSSRDGPFFLNLWTYAVHAPYEAKTDRFERYHESLDPNMQPRKRRKVAAYAAMIESLDDAVGRVVEALRDHGLERSTVVVFTSDNGGSEGVTTNHPLRAGKGTPYEGGLRVPLIVWWPGTVTGAEYDVPVSGVDLLPTLLGAMRAPVPPDLVLDGVDLMPLLRGGDAGALDRPLVWHYPHYWQGLSPYSVIRRGPLKLVYWHERSRGELYDLVADPGERTNLAALRPRRARELSVELMDWLESSGAALPKPRRR